MAYRKRVFKPEQPSFRLIGKRRHLLGYQCIGALVSTGVAKPAHQKLFVTAADIHIIAALPIADSQFGVGKRVVDRPSNALAWPRL